MDGNLGDRNFDFSPPAVSKPSGFTEAKSTFHLSRWHRGGRGCAHPSFARHYPLSQTRRKRKPPHSNRSPSLQHSITPIPHFSSTPFRAALAALHRRDVGPAEQQRALAAGSGESAKRQELTTGIPAMLAVSLEHSSC